jgi:hypothetical protein
MRSSQRNVQKRKGQYSHLVDLMLRGRIHSFMTRTLNLSLLNLRSPELEPDAKI